MLSSLRGSEGIQEDARPPGLPVHILNCDMEIVQQVNKSLYPHPLKHLETDDPDGAYHKSPQPWGERHQVVKINEVPSTDVEEPPSSGPTASYRGPGVEKIRNYLALLAFEGCVNQYLVVFGVSELGLDAVVLWVKVTETNLQKVKEKILPILKTLAVVAYHGAPFMRHLRQVTGTVFQIGQVA